MKNAVLQRKVDKMVCQLRQYLAIANAFKFSERRGFAIPEVQKIKRTIDIDVIALKIDKLSIQLKPHTHLIRDAQHLISGINMF